MHTSPSGKSYIGQTSNYEKRCKDHQRESNPCRAFKKAIDKYGWDTITHEILLGELSLEEANKWEEFCIDLFDTFGENGYNLHTGGNNHIASRESINKMVETMMNKSPEERARIKQKELETRANRPDEDKQATIDKYTESFYSKSQDELLEIYKKRSITAKNKSQEQKDAILQKRIETSRLNKYGTLDETIIAQIKKDNHNARVRIDRKNNPEKYRKYDRVRVRSDEQKRKQLDQKKEYRIQNKEELNRRERERYAEKQRLKKLEHDLSTEEK